MSHEVISRTEIFSICCRIISLPPGQWEKCGQPPNDYPGWRMTIKGQSLGADWLGRIDIYTVASEPPQPGDVVYLREMEVRKRVGMVPHVSGRRPSERRVPLGTLGSTEAEVTDGYLRLDPAPDRDPKGRELQWETFPTEERDERLLREEILWSKEVWGSQRNGRAHTTGALIVAPGVLDLLAPLNLTPEGPCELCGERDWYQEVEGLRVCWDCIPTSLPLP